MDTITQELISEFETLSHPQKQEVLDFVEFLKTKRRHVLDKAVDKPNGCQLAKIMAEAAQENAFANFPDPAQWQREQRKDRDLPGRE